MQIQVNGNRIKCVRQNYCAEAKRGVTRQVLSFPRFTKRIEDIKEEKALKQLAALTQEERDQLAAWLIEKASESEQNMRKYMLLGLSGNIDTAIAALGSEESRAELDASNADALWLKIRDLQQALKAAGFKRPKLSGGGGGV